MLRDADTCESDIFEDKEATFEVQLKIESEYLFFFENKWEIECVMIIVVSVSADVGNAVIYRVSTALQDALIHHWNNLKNPLHNHHLEG